MDVNQIEAFLKVVEKGSFSSAAEALFITQPTISVRIQQLEKNLNAILFSRVSGKRVALTPAGEKILPYLQDAYLNIQKGIEALKQTSIDQKKIAISSPNHMGVEILPELLNQLYRIYPDMEFHVKIGMTPQIIDDLRKGEVDAGFAYLQSTATIKDLVAVQVTKEKMVLVCAPDHPLTEKEIVHPVELKNERIVTYSRPFLNTKYIDQYLQKEGLKDYKSVEIDNLGWIKMMVRKGLGVAFLQKNIVSDELKNKALVELPIGKPLPTTPIYLLFRPVVHPEIRQTIINIAKKLFF